MSTQPFGGIYENLSHVTTASPHEKLTENNLSLSVWAVASQWLWNIAGTLNLLLGTFGNIMCLVILHQMRSGTSSIHMYLIALALTDMVTLCSGLGMNWVNFVFGLDIHALHDWGCKIGLWIVKSSAASSSWLLVAMTIHRAGSVVFPHRVNVVCTRGRTKVIIAAIPTVMVLFYFHMLYGLGVERGVCSLALPSYMEFWLKIWVNFDLVFFSILPFCLLVISNTVLAWHLLLSVNVAKSHLTSEKSEHHVIHRKKQTSSTTVTILAVSVTFVLLTGPLMIYNTISNVHGNKALIKDRDQAMFLYNVFFWMTSMNCALNFYLYCLTGTKFRQRFVHILCCWCSRKKKSPYPGTSSERSSELSQVNGEGRKGKPMDADDDF